MRGKKADKFNILKLKENFRNSKEYKDNFFRYIPDDVIKHKTLKTKKFKSKRFKSKKYKT